MMNLIPFIVMFIICNTIACCTVIAAYKKGYEEIEIQDDDFLPIKIAGVILCKPGFYFARDIVIAIYEKIFK